MIKRTFFLQSILMLTVLTYWSASLFSQEKNNEQLLQDLSHQDPDVRYRAASRLQGNTDPKTHAAVVNLLNNQDPKIRSSAVSALKGTTDPDTLSTIVLLLNDSSLSVRSSASYGLGGTTDPKTLAALIVLLSNRDEKIREGAAHALRETKDAKTLEELVKLLKYADKNVKKSIEPVLQGTKDQKTLKAIASLIENDDFYVRESAAYILRDTTDPKTLAVLISFLENKKSYIQKSAVFALRGTADPNAQLALVHLLKDPNNDVKENASLSLRGTRNQKVLNEIVTLLENKNPYIQETAANALFGINEPKTLKKLIALLTNSETMVQINAALALAGTTDADALAALVLRLEDPDSKVQERAALSIRGTMDPKTLEALVGLIKHHDIKVRTSAASALYATTDAKTLQALVALLKQSDQNIRTSAALALNSSSEDKVADILNTFLVPQTDEAHRCEVICQVLKEKLNEDFIKQFNSKNSKYAPIESWNLGLQSIRMLLLTTSKDICKESDDEKIQSSWQDSLTNHLPNSDVFAAGEGDKMTRDFNNSPVNYGFLYSIELFNLWEKQKNVTGPLDKNKRELKEKLLNRVKARVDSNEFHRRATRPDKTNDSNLNGFLTTALDASLETHSLPFKSQVLGITSKLKGKCQTPYYLPQDGKFTEGLVGSSEIGSAGRSVVLYYDYWRQVKGTENEAEAKKWLIGCLKNYGRFALTNQKETVRPRAHQGEYGIAPYYYYPSLAYALPLMKYFEKDDPSLKNMRESIVDQTLTFWDREKKALILDGENNFESHHYAPMLLALSLLSSVEACKGVPNNNPLGLLQGSLGEESEANTTPLNSHEVIK